MLAWLKVHDHRTKAPSCKKSVADRPGDPVYACLYEEVRVFHYAVPMKWWIFYRRVEGRWTLVNERIIASATADRFAPTSAPVPTRSEALPWRATGTQSLSTRHRPAR